MLYREIIAVCSQIHTKHINTLCGQNVEFLNVKLVVHIVTIEISRTISIATRFGTHDMTQTGPSLWPRIRGITST